MAEIAFKFSAGTDIVQKEMDIEKRLWNISQSVAGINRSMTMKLKNSSQIGWQMQQILRQLDTEKSKVNAMHQAMSAITENYRSTEESIIGAAWAGIGRDDVSNQDAAKTEQPVQKEETNIWLDLFKKVIGEFGAAGTVFKMIAGWRDSSIFKKLGDVCKIIGKGASAVDDSGIKWGSLIGIADMEKYKDLKPSDSRFSFALKEELGDYAFDTAKTGAKKSANKVGVVAKWFGKVLSVADNGYENYKEHGGFSTPRFWQEFITESAIDIGKDFLFGVAAGAGAAAVAGAGVIATAPAWVGVAAVTAAGIGISAGLDWLADQITKAVTGNSEAEMTETISDAIWDSVAR